MVLNIYLSLQASVRLLINYNKSHKTVVRVNPRVPLEMLLPVVCDKCEFNSETTILLRDSHSKEPLDLTKTLNEHGLRELFAKDTAEVQDQPKTPEPGMLDNITFVYQNWHHNACHVCFLFVLFVFSCSAGQHMSSRGS